MSTKKSQKLITIFVAILAILAFKILSTLKTYPVIAANKTEAFSFQKEQGFQDETQLLAQASRKKAALVIGNADYEDDPLENPINDANAIYKILNELNFDVPPPLINANKKDMVEAVRQFQDRLEVGGFGVFYYAGHGIQVDRRNYLVPLDADLEREAEAEFEAFELTRVINMMNDSETKLNVLFIDACRNNPFYRKWRKIRGSENTGLNVTRPPRGTIIAYATGPNEVAEDGNVMEHSPYTQGLIKYLKTPNKHILEMLSLVAEYVLEITKDKQFPYVEGYISGYLSFNPAPRATITPPLLPEIPPSPDTSPLLPSQPSNQRNIIVALDPGHGGTDLGTIGIGGLQEKGLTITISSRIKEQLEERGIQVVMTRSDDNFVSLENRVNFIKKENASIFVSIHGNAINLSQPDINGIETYYHNSSSKKLAELIHQQVLNDVDTNDRGIRKARYYVLRNLSIPSVLFQTGFLTGAEDAARFKDPAAVLEIADSISQGIFNYLEQREEV